MLVGCYINGFSYNSSLRSWGLSVFRVKILNVSHLQSLLNHSALVQFDRAGDCTGLARSVPGCG